MLFVFPASSAILPPIVFSFQWRFLAPFVRMNTSMRSQRPVRTGRGPRGPPPLVVMPPPPSSSDAWPPSTGLRPTAAPLRISGSRGAPNRSS